MYVEGVRLASWLIEEGAHVDVGEPLFELESDKASQDIEAESPGWVHQHLQADTEVAVGETIGVIAATEESYREAVAAQAAPDASPSAAPAPLAPAAAATADVRVERADSPAAIPSGAAEIVVAPRARQLLAEHSISAADVAAGAGTAPGRRITDRDVLAFLAARSDGADAPDLTIVRSIPLRGRRRVIANRMVDSLRVAPQLTSVLEVDATAVVASRARGAAAGRPLRHVTLFAAAAVGALRASPDLNALVVEDEIRVVADINLAIAVETPEGVVAPVVHHADRLSVAELDGHIGALIERVRGGNVTPSDGQGATFTLSSSGGQPVDLTTAILNPPQVGILWLGRITPRAVVRDGAIVARPTVQACLTYDHRAIDGAPAAAFLGAFAESVEGLTDGDSETGVE